ncbi:MAG: peptidoglycan-associated lipoprotein Pal [Moraxella sp.]|nr:peptidoglycan-associated lipoprotein Pal [Moraxella sp.]
MLTRTKLTLAGITLAIFATGCTTKPSNQQVLVAPMGITGYQGPAYQGGQLINNSEQIKAAAANLPSVVFFDFDSDVIKPEAMQVLDTQANFLKANQTAKVLVAGHTDERGSREYNISLGERRAAAVRAYLANQGVSVTNIEIISFGEERPAVLGSGEANWSQNRRAELSY